MVDLLSGSLTTFFIFVTCQSVGWLVTAAPQISYQETDFAQKYLRQYHYLSPLRDGNHDWQTALRMFQRNMHLPVTGELDPITLREMQKPRCGVPDLEDEVDFGPDPGAVSKRYQVTAEKWNRTSLNYAFESTGDDLPASTVRAIFQKAFSLWSDPSSLTFTEILDVKAADIKIRFVKGAHYPCSYDFDKKGGILAHAFFPQSGFIHFDDDETFTHNSPLGTNLLSVAAHEIGHVLGLHHSSEREALMNAEYQGYVTSLSLHADDVNGIQYLYGAGSSSSSQSSGSKCADKMSNCEVHKSSCTASGFFGQTMKYNCPMTCGQCSNGGASVVAPSCKDIFTTCQQLQTRYNFCNRTVSWQIALMKKNCRKTCSYCSSG